MKGRRIERALGSIANWKVLFATGSTRETSSSLLEMRLNKALSQLSVQMMAQLELTQGYSPGNRSLRSQRKVAGRMQCNTATLADEREVR